MLRLHLNRNGRAVTKGIECIRFMSYQVNSRNSEQIQSNRERLIVRLCGRINQIPTELDNDKIIIPMITKNAHDEYYAKHRVFASVSQLQNLPDNRLEEGQRIYVTGVIKYSVFQRAEGHSKQAGQIHSTNILLCEQNEDPSSDVNDVILFGFVIYKPEITENVTFVEVATQFFDRKEQTYKRNVHDVMIKEDVEMRQRANCLNVGDDVFIHGFMSTTNERNQEGKLRLRCRIRPRKLIVCQKPAKFARANSIYNLESPAN